MANTTLPKDPARAHARFSPSSAARWLACPGSVAAIEECPTPPESPAAVEGTTAHVCLETILKNGVHKLLSSEAFLRKSYPFEMVKYSAWAAQEIWALRPHPRVELHAEAKACCAHIHEEFYGTLDACIVEDFGTLKVIDFKYGRMPVEAGANPQLIAYAIAEAHRHQYNFDTVDLVIVQPRAAHPDGYTRSWTMPVKDLFTWSEKFKRGIEAALKKNADRSAGKHCFFCPAKGDCFAYSPTAASGMRGGFIQPKSAEERRAQLLLDFGAGAPERAAPTVHGAKSNDGNRKHGRK